MSGFSTLLTHINSFEHTTLAQDHITLEDYEIHDGMGLELFYN